MHQVSKQRAEKNGINKILKFLKMITAEVLRTATLTAIFFHRQHIARK